MEHHRLAPYPIPKEKTPLCINEPWLIDKSLLEYAKKLITMMLEDAKAEGVSVIELKATEDGYSLYKSVGFEDVVAKYHNMKIVVH